MALAPIDIGVDAILDPVRDGLPGIIDEPSLDLRCHAVPVALNVSSQFRFGRAGAAQASLANRAGERFDIAGETGHIPQHTDWDAEFIVAK